MMAPQNEAGAHEPVIPHHPDLDDDDDDGDFDIVDHAALNPPQRRHLGGAAASPPVEIASKFRELGVDLVRHIVVTSVASPPPSPDEPLPPFPPNVGGVSFINLLTTDRETLTMRRLVTKALLDKSHSFTAMIYILPRIPVDVAEFRDVFGLVVDRMIALTPPQQPVGEELEEAYLNVSWGKVVTAYAFGLRLIKASIDQRRDVEDQLLQRPEGGADVAAAIAPDFDAHEWGSAMGEVMNSRMGSWIHSVGGWSDGFNDYFLDRRGLEEVITKKLLYVFALGVGVAIFFKLVKK